MYCWLQEPRSKGRGGQVVLSSSPEQEDVSLSLLSSTHLFVFKHTCPLQQDSDYQSHDSSEATPPAKAKRRVSACQDFCTAGLLPAGLLHESIAFTGVRSAGQATTWEAFEGPGEHCGVECASKTAAALSQLQ